MIKSIVNQKGYIAAILAPFFIALSVILANELGQSASPLVISALAPLISVPVLFVIAQITREKLQLRRLVTELRAPFLKILLSRSIIGQIMIVYGFTMTTAFKGVLLLRVEPLFVYIWGLYYGRVTAKPGKIALLLALIGGSILAVLPSGSPETAIASVSTAGATTAAGITSAVLGPAPIANNGLCLGDALVVCSLLFISYSYGPTGEVVESASPAGLNLLLNLISGLIIGVMVFVSQPHLFAIGGQTLGLLAAYSIVFFVLGSSLYFEAFRTLKPWVIASFLSLEVVFGLFLSAVLLHESFGPTQLVGGAIVIAATIAIGRSSE